MDLAIIWEACKYDTSAVTTFRNFSLSHYMIRKVHVPIFRKVLSSAGRMGCLPQQLSGGRLAVYLGGS